MTAKKEDEELNNQQLGGEESMFAGTVVLQDSVILNLKSLILMSPRI